MGGRISAGTVVGGAPESTAADPPEVAEGGVLASCSVGTEPGGVSTLAGRETYKIRGGTSSIGLGVLNGDPQQRLPGRCTTDETDPLVVDVGDSKGTGEVNLSSIVNGGIDVFEGAVGIDIGE